MEDLASKIKYVIVGLGFLTTSYLPLNAQKHETDYFEKTNLSHCISGRSIKHNSYYFKKEKVHNYCISEESKKNKKEYLKRDNRDNYCVSVNERKYSRHSPKVNTRRRR